MSGVPGMRRKVVRATTCHPDREHHAKGLCKACYQRLIKDELMSGARIPRGKKTTIWPQNIVRGIPKGWGSIT
jgi:hypothetical protein